MKTLGLNLTPTLAAGGSAASAGTTAARASRASSRSTKGQSKPAFTPNAPGTGLGPSSSKPSPKASKTDRPGRRGRKSDGAAAAEADAAIDEEAAAAERVDAAADAEAAALATASAAAKTKIAAEQMKLGLLRRTKATAAKDGSVSVLW